jgi:hypothetical protein
VFWTEGDHDTLWFHFLRLCISVKPAGANWGLYTGEVNVVNAFASKASRKADLHRGNNSGHAKNSLACPL